MGKNIPIAWEYLIGRITNYREVYRKRRKEIDCYQYPLKFCSPNRSDQGGGQDKLENLAVVGLQ